MQGLEEPHRGQRQLQKSHAIVQDFFVLYVFALFWFGLVLFCFVVCCVDVCASPDKIK